MSLTLSRHEQYQDSEAAKYNSANIQFRDHPTLTFKNGSVEECLLSIWQ